MYKFVYNLSYSVGETSLPALQGPQRRPAERRESAEEIKSRSETAAESTTDKPATVLRPESTAESTGGCGGVGVPTADPQRVSCEVVRDEITVGSGAGEAAAGVEISEVGVESTEEVAEVEPPMPDAPKTKGGGPGKGLEVALFAAGSPAGIPEVGVGRASSGELIKAKMAAGSLVNILNKSITDPSICKAPPPPPGRGSHQNHLLSF